MLGLPVSDHQRVDVQALSAEGTATPGRKVERLFGVLVAKELCHEHPGVEAATLHPRLAEPAEHVDGDVFAGRLINRGYEQQIPLQLGQLAHLDALWEGARTLDGG